MSWQDNRKLTIVFVCDDYDNMKTGGVITVSRFTEVLRSMGHTIRIIAPGTPKEGKYVVPSYNPHNCIMQLAYNQGVTLAKPDKAIIREALTGADVVYLLMPSPLSYAAIKMAREMNIAVTAGFHVLAENATYTIHMGWCKPLSWIIYYMAKWLVYDKVNYIHCPTQMVEDLLKSYHYKGNFYVFSNGTIPFFHPIKVERLPQLKDKFVVISVGRYNNEKRQDLVIKAVAKCKYNKDMVLILAGQGPNAKRYKKLAKALYNPVIMQFCTQEELRDYLNMSDLYVHAADAEIESMSCTEAFSCGLVPVISNAKRSATQQFALTERNIFKAGSVDSLVEQLEYWFEHREEKEQMSKQYLELSKKYSIQFCAERMVQMFRDALNDPKERKQSQE